MYLKMSKEYELTVILKFSLQLPLTWNVRLQGTSSRPQFWAECYLTVLIPHLSVIRAQVKVALLNPACRPPNDLKLGNVLVKVFKRGHWHSRCWQRPFCVLLTTHTVVNVAVRAIWIHSLQCKKVESAAGPSAWINRHQPPETCLLHHRRPRCASRKTLCIILMLSFLLFLMQNSTFASATEGSREINHLENNHNLWYRAVHTPKMEKNW